MHKVLRHLLCCCLPMFSFPQHSDADTPSPTRPFHVFLLVGQSNMAGRAKIEAGDRGPIEDAWLWNIGDKKWERAETPFNRHSQNRKPMNMQRLNPGPGFVKAYLKTHPDVSVGIVCSARGGTRIEEWEKGLKKPWPLYDDAIAAAKDALKTGGQLKGILWHQGEGNAGFAQDYPPLLSKLIRTFRAEFGNSELPFVFSQVGDWNPDYAAFNAMIVKQPAAIPRTACVRTGGLTNMDNAHFDSRSQRELGKRYAEALEPLLK